ncbi:hypothetical protein BKA70DRAFT_4386 [Coprinopsis sp. MPI-PUGE-AT-0042]|nr:hypothetical protein BKA70DRAFT_4386 [Coprinopsis sp. MPI-PUGE-AT-0042]
MPDCLLLYHVPTMPFSLHSFLHYSQHQQPTDPSLYCSLVWDLRESPASSARHVSKLDAPLSSELAHPATYPPVARLSITCNLLPDGWVMEATNASYAYVTLLDVLQAIYTCLHVPLQTSEWDALSPKQQDRVQDAFRRRCAQAIDPAQCELTGKLRIDRLARHTLFGGLTPSLEDESSYILSLRRPHP